MPVTPTYPGVYIQEAPSGVRTIIGVATSITAFIGRAQRGPVNEARSINNYGDFERIFGGLWQKSSLGFAVRDFYLNGGSQAIIVRLFTPTFADDQARQQAFTAAQGLAQTAADAVSQAAGTAAGVQNATAQDVADAAQGVVAAASQPGAAAASAAQAVAKAAADKAKEQAATPADVANAAAGAVANAVKAAAGAEAPITKASIAWDTLSLQAAYEGAWGNALRARVDHEISADYASSIGLQTSDLFNLTVRDTKSGLTESFRNLTMKPGLRQVNKVLENDSRLVRIKGDPSNAAVPNKHSDITPGKDPFSDDNMSTGVASDAMASDGKELTSASFVGQGMRDKKEGLFALEQSDLFNLLCIPPYLQNGDIDSSLIDQAAAYCTERRAMLLIDPPVAWNDKDKAKTGIASGVGSTTKNAAVFFPRLRQPNPLREGQMEDFAPCGAVAGLFARTDAQRGVWKAPAGLEATLVGVPQLSVALTDAENGELNPLGINCLRSMPAAGRIVWGSRTRVGDDRLASEWKYIPIRRLALFIEESLYRGTQWVVFEPNDEPLWAQIRLNLGAFMHTLFRQGAFQGRTPQEAYFVKCDKETTTQTDRNMGIVNIVVGFAPLKPAEFVIITLQQIAGQIQA
jgi:uncharacterized protein